MCKIATFLKRRTIVLVAVLSIIITYSALVYSNPSGNECYHGIDVSFWNGNINWNEVKNNGKIQFAIIRTSFGWSNREKFTDTQLKNNIKGAKAVGIPIGAYHYSYAKNLQQAIWEADFFIDRLKWTQWEYPVFMDIEDPSQLKELNNEQRTDIIITFLDRVERAGYFAGFYTNLNWTKNYLNMDRLSRFTLWIAQWNNTCHCQRPYGLWQHTSKGRVPGIDGNVDLDISYINYPKIIKEGGYNGFKPQKFEEFAKIPKQAKKIEEKKNEQNIIKENDVVKNENNSKNIAVENNKKDLEKQAKKIIEKSTGKKDDDGKESTEPLKT